MQQYISYSMYILYRSDAVFCCIAVFYIGVENYAMVKGMIY